MKALVRGTLAAVALPGSVALAFYMNESVAIEPQLGLLFVSGEDGAGDDFSGTELSAGLFVPFYLKGDTGRSGFFMSPGLLITKGTGDLETDAAVDYGIDVGMKMTRNDRVSTRFAVTLRDGDSFADATLGATFGVGLFWR